MKFVVSQVCSNQSSVFSKYFFVKKYDIIPIIIIASFEMCRVGHDAIKTSNCRIQIGFENCLETGPL